MYNKKFRILYHEIKWRLKIYNMEVYSIHTWMVELRKFRYSLNPLASISD